MKIMMMIITHHCFLYVFKTYLWSSCCSIQSLSSELLVVSSIISIPILEPLSAARVEKVCQLALGCLDVALTIATGNFNIVGAAGGWNWNTCYWYIIEGWCTKTAAKNLAFLKWIYNTCKNPLRGTVYVNSYLGLHCSETAGNFFLMKSKLCRSWVLCKQGWSIFCRNKEGNLESHQNTEFGLDNEHHNAHCEVPCSSC